MPRYNVLTWDACAEQYTEQDGLSVPSVYVPLMGVRRALQELRAVFGYTCHRMHYPDGSVDSDAAVLVERV